MIKNLTLGPEIKCLNSLEFNKRVGGKTLQEHLNRKKCVSVLLRDKNWWSTLYSHLSAGTRKRFTEPLRRFNKAQVWTILYNNEHACLWKHLHIYTKLIASIKHSFPIKTDNPPVYMQSLPLISVVLIMPKFELHCTTLTIEDKVLKYNRYNALLCVRSLWSTSTLWGEQICF